MKKLVHIGRQQKKIRFLFSECRDILKKTCAYSKCICIIIMLCLWKYSLADNAYLIHAHDLYVKDIKVSDTLKISGIVLDAVGGPIERVTVNLSIKDVVLTSTMTDSLGRYQFGAYAAAGISLHFKHLGFEGKKITIAPESHLSLPLYTILEHRNALKINEVEVVGRKRGGLSKTLEGFSFQIDESLRLLSIWEIMKQTPLIDAREDGTLNVLGKSGIQLYLNGRKTNLAGNDLVEMLKNISSENLKNIEIITSPSSKYEAQGNAGIINIVLKKQQTEGLLGTANLTSEFANYGSYRGNININHSKGKVATQMNMRATKAHNRIIEETNFTLPSIDLQNHSYLTRNEKNNPLGVMLINDITFNAKNSLFIQTNLSHSSSDLNWLSINNFKSLESARQQKSITTQSLLGNSNTYVNFDINDQIKLDTFGSQLSIAGSYFTQEGKGDAKYVVLSDMEQLFFQTSSKQRVRNYSAQIDFHKYMHSRMTFDAGIMVNVAHNKSKNILLNKIGEKFVNDLSKENDYSYEEYIYALYSSLSWKISNRLNSMIGFRLEKTDIEGFEVISSKSVNKNYINLFPNLSLTYNLNQIDKLGLTIGSRISRPGFWELNPTPTFSAPNLYYKGNAFLVPSRSLNAEVNYILRQKLTFLLNYTRVNDDWMQFQVTKPGSDTIMYDRFNYGHKNISGLSINYYDNYDGGRLRVNTNVAVNHAVYKGSIPGRTVDERSWVKLFRFRTDYNFDKVGNKSIYLSYAYFSPITSAQGLLKMRQSFEAGGMFKVKKFTFQVSGRDLFNQSIFRTEVVNGKVSSSNGMIDPSVRRLIVTLGYSFGNMKTRKAEQVGGAASEQKGRVQY